MRRLLVVAWIAWAGTVVVDSEAAAQSLPDTVSSLPWVTDGGIVAAATAVGDTVYIGGSFRSVARPSDRIGPFGVFDPSTGELIAADPATAGDVVTAAVDDGTGGWYLAGSFLAGGSFDGLIHVDASGRRLGLPLVVSAISGVRALARRGNVLYLGGGFSALGTQSRANVGAIDVASGAVLPWNPGTDGDVEELHVDGADVYLGGRFQSVGGLPRTHLARVDADSGAVSPWVPQLSGAALGVRALAVTSDRVYIGGDFTTVGGLSRSGLAAVDRASGAVLPFAPQLSGGLPLVEAVALSGSLIYAAGLFDTAGGAARPGVVALDAALGTATDWVPAAGGQARALAVDGPHVFVGGSLAAAGVPRTVVRLSAASGAVDEAWNPAPGGLVEVIVAGAGRVLLGGGFSTYRATPAAGLAAFSLSSGAYLPMPAVTGQVDALASSGTTLFVAGTFSRVGSEGRQAIAAINTVSRTVLPFAPAPELQGAVPFFPQLRALAVEGNTLYFGGRFSHVAGQPRAHVAAVDVATGALRAFAIPQLTLSQEVGVQGLAVANGRLWVGGHIAHVAPARQWLLVADAVTGAIDPVDYALNGAVWSVARDESAVYASGVFTAAGGSARPGVVKIATATAALQSWPNTVGATYGDRVGVDAGIVFTPAIAAGTPSLAALGAASGERLPWAPLNGMGYFGVWGVGAGVLAAGPNYGRPPVSPAFFKVRSASGAPAAVQDFSAHLQGTLVTLRWTPGLLGAAPTAYRLEAGSAPGLTDVARLNVGTAPALVTEAPAGRYFVRVVPLANGVEGPASRELAFVAGASGCATPPGAPVLSVSGAPPVLSWTAPTGTTVSAWELRAGTVAGQLTSARLVLPASTASFSTAGVTPGNYYAAVAAVNACGMSAVSNEVSVTVLAPSAPSAPTALTASVAGRTVTLSWTPPPGTVTGYVLEAGTAPGLANLVGGLALGPSPTFVAANVASGTYYVRARAVSGGLTSVPSNEVVVRVP